MSDDYLWDKTGTDPEIEQLERTLGKLRYRAQPVSISEEARPPEREVEGQATLHSRVNVDRSDAGEAHALRRGDGTRPDPVAVPPRARARVRESSGDRAARPRPSSVLAAGRRLFPGRGSPLAAGLLLGMFAGLLAWSGIKKKEADVRRGWNLVPVVVASQDLPEGTVVTLDMISQRAVPEQFVTSSVVKPDGASYVVNQKVLVPVQAGDPLLWSQFESTRAAERLSAKVQKKTRAVTIATNAVSSVGGWVRPNDHVDIIGSFRDPQTNENVAVTLLQNVVVLATGAITGTTNVNLLPEAEREYSNVSLMVLPEEAELLVLASEVGSLTLALRSADDMDTFEERGRATIQTLMSGERTRVLQARRREVIQIIRGSAPKAE